MTCAVVAKADRSGIAVQSWEMARHVQPDKVLVWIPDDNERRGPAAPERFDTLGADVRVVRGAATAADVTWLTDGVDAVYLVESPPGYDRLAAHCEHVGVQLVIHANPELWSARYATRATRVYVPTTWEAKRVPGAAVIPMPVARDVLPFRQRTQARRFLFPAGTTFHDRNGYQLVQKATRHIDRQIRLTVSPWHRAKPERRVGGSTLIDYRLGVEDYATVYDDFDVLVLPRRYGGLSLPIQEAASCGLAIVTLDVEPYRAFVHPAGLVETTGYERVHMKGGEFSVWQASARALAGVLVRLAGDDGLVAEMSAHSNAWAASLDWRLWQGEWRRALST